MRRKVALASLISGVLALGQVADVWSGFLTLPEPDRKLLEEVATQTGLTRTWILYRATGGPTTGRPDAVYRTTLAFGSAKQEQLVDAQVRRYGRILVAYRLESGGNTQPVPTWVGYDVAGANAGALDRFYAAIERSDLTGARDAAKVFLSNDLDVAARLAALEQKAGNAADAAKALGSVKDTAIIPKGLGELLQKHLKEDTDFSAVNAISLILAHRRLLVESRRKVAACPRLSPNKSWADELLGYPAMLSSVGLA